MLPTEIGEGYSVCKRRGTILIVASDRESIVPTEKAGLLAYSSGYHPSHPFLTGQWILRG